MTVTAGSGSRVDEGRRATRLWLVARLALGLAAVALVLACWFALRPVSNPGVQDCGPPLTFAMGGDNVRLRASDPAITPGQLERVDQPSCRERTDEQLSRAGIALVAFIAFGLIGAVLGLIDDRLALRRAPRFESMLRDRPDVVPGRSWNRPVVPVDDVGRRLPEVEGRDVARLVTGGALTILGLLLVVGLGDGLDAVLGLRAAPVLGLAVLVVLGWALTVLERDAAHRSSVPPSGRATAAVATSFASPVLPEFGASGLDAHHEVELGAPRERAVAEAGALVVAAAGVHGLLLVVLTLVVVAGGAPDAALPSRGLVVAIAALPIAVAGAVTAPRRWRQLVVSPDPSAWRLLRDGASNPAAVAQLVATAAGLALLPGVAVWVAAEAVGADVRLDVALGLGLLAVTAGVVLGPWPAGVGIVEAVLVLGLWRAGVGAADAVAAVIVLRVVLLWLPIAPGYVAARKV